jgi:predicted RNase H-related nuclease YkuK (DUF458 family)
MKRSDAGIPGRMAHVETPMNRSYLFADVTVAIAAENATVDIDRSRDRDVDCETVYNMMTGTMRSTGTRHEITPFIATATRLEQKRTT